MSLCLCVAYRAACFSKKNTEKYSDAAWKWRNNLNSMWQPTGIWSRVVSWIQTNVSEDNNLHYQALMMAAVRTSETSVHFYRITRRGCHLHSRCRENMKPHKFNSDKNRRERFNETKNNGICGTCSICSMRTQICRYTSNSGWQTSRIETNHGKVITLDCVNKQPAVVQSCKWNSSSSNPQHVASVV
jgi:hypothetical protein